VVSWVCSTFQKGSIASVCISNLAAHQLECIMAVDTTKITATCACKAFTIDVHFPTSSLPLDRALCLCNSCLKLSGSCGVSYIRIPSSQTIDPSKFNLTSYETSADVTRYFCSTCGAHIGCNEHSVRSWALATGLWDRTEGIIDWTGCKFVEDTQDGGISVWLNDIVEADGKKRKLLRWKYQDAGGELVPDGYLRDYVYLRPRGGSEERLHASCHCGGVKFYITRPNEDSKKARSPFPDLMVPFHTGASPENPENETWWIPHNYNRYMAGTCTCKSCRLASGFEIQPWAFVPKCNIFLEDGSTMEYSFGTLQRYLSSENIWREFCSICGATVFWHCSWRPDLVDVSVGLFDPIEGARAEGWLEWWTGRVSFEEMAVSRSLVRSLEDGLKEWQGEIDMLNS